MSIDRRVRITRQTRRGSTWLISLLALLTVAAATAAIVALRTLRADRPERPPALRLALNPPDDLAIGGGSDYPFGLALAADGRRLLFPAAKDGVTQLWMRDLATGETQSLPGTDEAVLPFWAPDGRAIAFFANKRLRVMTLEDAVIRDVADAPSPRGGVWHESGDIIFAPENDGPLYRRQAATGAVEPLTVLDASSGELSHRLPALVDRGRHLLFFVRATAPTRQGIWIASMATPANRKRLAGAIGHALALGDGIVFPSDGALLAQHLDLEALALTGRPVLLGTAVGAGPQHQSFATTNGDTLIFGAPASSLRELRWVDRTGTRNWCRR